MSIASATIGEHVQSRAFTYEIIRLKRYALVQKQSSFARYSCFPWRLILVSVLIYYQHFNISLYFDILPVLKEFLLPLYEMSVQLPGRKFVVAHSFNMQYKQ